MLAWDEIMSKCPTMKKLIEDKISEEVAPLQQRIAELETQINATPTNPVEG